MSAGLKMNNDPQNQPQIPTPNPTPETPQPQAPSSLPVEAPVVFPFQTAPEQPVSDSLQNTQQSFPQAPKKSRKKLFILLASILGGLILIGVGVSITLAFIHKAQSSQAAELSKNLPYEYAAPILNVSETDYVNFPISYSPDSLDSYKKNQNYHDAIKVFTDSSLTHPANADVIPEKSGLFGNVSNFRVRPENVDLVAKQTYDGSGKSVTLSPAGAWGPNNEYYIVQYLDGKGNKLAKPIVTRVTVKKPLSTPDVRTSVSADGVVTFNWQQVSGAKNYYIAKFTYKKAADGSIDSLSKSEVIGNTTSTTWTSADQDETAKSTEGVQNTGFKSFDKSEDELHGGTLVYTDTAQYSTEYGVIAANDPNGKDFYETSSYEPIDGDSLNKQVPYSLASNASDEILNSTPDTIAGIPETMPVTLADGSTVLRSVVIDPSRTKIDNGKLVVYFSVAGTNVKYYITVGSFNSSTYPADVQAVAARNAAAQQKAGAAVAYQYIEPRSTLDNVSKTRPTVPYQVNSTDAFSDYLAANMIAGNELIDVSKYVNASSLSLSDVIYQAKYQNPYILGFEGYTYHADAKVLEVKYAYNSKERADYQKKLSDASQSIIAKIITPGMSDREKALAINNYLVSSGSYNYNAFAVINDATKVNSPEFRDNWSAVGILLNKSGVCQSYSDAFKLLADAAGLKAIVVTGDTDTGKHAWNKVFIDGKWTNVDVTWDDNAQGNTTELFGLTDAVIQAQYNHTEDNWFAIDGLVPTYAAN